MQLPFKPTYVLAGVGVTGTGAAGIVGINSLVASGRTGGDIMSREGLSFGPKTLSSSFEVSSIGTTSVSVSNQLQNLSPGGCFSTFFPGAVDPGMPTSPGSAGAPDDVSLKAGSGSGAVGCKLMNFAQTQGEKSAFIYRSEVTVRTGKVGLALFSGATNWQRHSSAGGKVNLGELYLTFKLLVLKKESDRWSIKVGYVWKRDAAHNAERFNDFLIEDPETHTQWFGQKKTDNLTLHSGLEWSPDYSTDDKWTTQHSYSGIWRTDPDSKQSQEVFGPKSSVEMWGLTYGGSSTKFPTIQDVYSIYNGSVWGGGKTWLDLSHSYVPFKGRRGSWKDIGSYCNDLSPRTGLSRGDVDNLRDLCYSKPT